MKVTGCMSDFTGHHNDPYNLPLCPHPAMLKVKVELISVPFLYVRLQFS